MPTLSIDDYESSRDESICSKVVMIYVASPLGFTSEGRLYLRKELLPKLNNLPNVGILDPWADVLKKTERQITKSKNNSLTRSVALKIGDKNFRMIDESHVIFACLNGTDADGGTCIEIGYGHKAGKLVIAYRSDLRLCGETNSMITNLQAESAVHRSGGKIFNNLDSAVLSLRRKLPDLRLIGI